MHGAMRIRVAVCLTLAVAAIALAAEHRLERRMGLVTDPSLIFEVAVPAEARYQDLETTWGRRLRGNAVVRGVTGDAVVVEVFGAGPRHEDEIAAALTRSGQFELREVVDDSLTARRWSSHARWTADELAPATVQPDAWTSDDGIHHDDFYVMAPTLAAAEAAIAKLDALEPRPPDERDLVVAFEQVAPEPEANRPAFYRSYLIAPAARLDYRHVASASVGFDPYTNRPRVDVTLTDQGGRLFGELTAELTGHKLAILVEDEVKAAPIIMGPIRQGRMKISMGGHDPRRQEAEATALAHALNGGAVLPRGLRAHRVGARAGDASLIWPVRGALGLLVAGLAWIAGVAAARRRWFLRTPEAVVGAGRIDRLAVPTALTIGLPLLLWYAGRHVLLPGINEVELANLFAAGGGGQSAMTQVGVFALGASPVLGASVLVELIAVLAPGWRVRRLGTPSERAGLDRAVLVLAIGLALLQGYFIAQYLEGMSSRGAELVMSTGTSFRALVAISLAAGVAIHMYVAGVISRHGLCNGWLAILAGQLVAVVLVQAEAPPAGQPDPRLGFLTIGLVAGAAAVLATRVRSTDGRRLPWAGVVPAKAVAAVFAAHQLVAMIWPELGRWVAEHRPPSPLIDLFVAIPLTGLIVWTGRRTLPAAGMAVTTAVVVAILVLPLAVDEGLRPAAPTIDAMMLALIGVEVAIGIRARAALADPVAALVVHDVERADAAADALRDAGIPHALTGVRARALLRFFGALVPVTVVVARADVERASAALAACGPSRDGKIG